MNYLNILILLTSLLLCSHSFAIQLPSVLSDNMMIQRDKAVCIWGKCAPGATITVEFSKQKKETVASGSGDWRVMLDPMSASFQPLEMHITTDSGEPAVRLQNILVGDIWLCGGQSNMQFLLSKSDHAADATKQPANEQIRYFYQAFNGAPNPLFDCVRGTWKQDDPHSRQWVSAVAWYFIQEIYQSEQIPVALLQANQGGSSAQMWTPLEDLKGDQEFQSYIDAYTTKTQTYDSRKETYLQKKEAGEKISIIDHYGWFPVAAYNAMIHPVQNFTLKGVIWYQGEANSAPDDALLYRKLFPTMINAWRREFNDPELPFLFVQLPNFGGKPDRDWATLRESQALTAKQLDHTGMAITIDVGESDNIHPTLKKPVGERLAKIALNKLYNKPIEYAAPSVQKSEIVGNTIMLHFDRPIASKDGKPLREFTICGADQQFVEATATIKGNTIIVFCPKVPSPVAVRYAWHNDPQVNLFGTNGLPVAPFQTDL